jgi:hypothetical protein
MDEWNRLPGAASAAQKLPKAIKPVWWRFCFAACTKDQKKTSKTSMKIHKPMLGALTIVWGILGQAQAQSFLTNGLVAYYPFNGNALDASGNGNNGQLTAGTFVSDRFGNPQGALEITNPPSVAGVLTTNLQTPGNVFSLSVWFRENSQSCGQLVSFGDSQGGHNFNADRNIVYCGGNLTFYVYPGYQVLLTTTNLPGDNLWHSTVATMSGTGMMLYLDGLLITNNASVTTAQAFSGYWQMARINGDVDDVRIYNRALSPAEVQELYLVESGPRLNLIKALKPSFSNLTLTTNYQLQVSGDLSTWTNQGSSFAATNTSMIYPQYFDVDNWSKLFFRLQVSP